MTHEMRAPEPEDLLRQSSWIRALALALVRDADVADDLVQETLLVALRHEEGVSRGWLSRVVRNLARQRWRGDIRRERREEVVAGAASDAEDLPTPAELAERLEQHRMLAEMVSALDEPLRSTVLLRYFEELPAATIARRQGIAAGTVRWRLKHALDLLRERLDRHWDGDRKAWCLAFLPLVTARSKAAASALSVGGLLHGVLAMSTGVKIAMVAAVLAAILWWWTGSTQDSWAPGSGGGRSGSTVVGEAEGSESEVEPAAIRSVPLGPEDEVADTKAKSSSSKKRGRSFRVRARCVDDQGRPLAGVELSAFQLLPIMPRLALDLAGVHLPIKETAREPVGVSDSEGVVDAEVRLTLIGAEGSFSAWCAGRARVFRSAELAEDRVTDLGILVLGPGAVVRGLVRDERGEALPGAVVRWRTTPVEPGFVASLADERVRPLYGAPWAYCDEDGRFELVGIVPGVGRVFAGADGYRPALSEPFDLDAGEERGGVELALASGGVRRHLLELVVRDEAGEPCPGVNVRGRFRGKSLSGTDRRKTDASGSVRYAWTGPREWSFMALPEGEAGLTAAIAGVTGEERRIELQLRPAARCEIRLRDRWGRPIPGVSVNVTGKEESDLLFVSGPTDDKGVTRIGVPPVEFALVVSSRGYVESRRGPFATEDPPARVDLRLEQLPGVSGCVRARGRRLAGANVTLHARTDPDGFTVTNGFPCDVEFTSQDQSESGEGGGFRLSVRAPGDYFVVARAEGFAPAIVGPLTLSPERAGEAVDLEMVRGGRIEGRFVTQDGSSPEGRIVGCSRGGFLARTTTVDASGRFRFAGLTPGRYMVQECDDPIDEDSFASVTQPGASRRFPWVCLVFDGRTTTWDLIEAGTPRGKPAILEGHLIHVRPDAGPVTAEILRDEAGMTPALRESTRLAQTTLDSTGRFRLELPHDGLFTLKLTGRGADHVAFVLEEPLVLEPGTNSWNLEISPATLSGIIHADDSGKRPIIDHVWTTPGGGHFATRLVPDATGQLRVTTVPAGPARLEPHDRRASPLRTFTLSPGQTRTLTIP